MLGSKVGTISIITAEKTVFSRTNVGEQVEE